MFFRQYTFKIIWCIILTDKKPISFGGFMEINIRDLILKVLENEGYLCELTSEGIIFVDDEDRDKTVAIHIQVTN